MYVKILAWMLVTSAGLGYVSGVADFCCPKFGLSDSYHTSDICEESSLISGKEEVVNSATSRPCVVVSDKAYCSYGDLESIPQDLPPNIRRLVLSHNHIRSIENRSLSKYANLDVLDLNHNSISHLSAESFYGLSKLRYLYLGHNYLSYVRKNFPTGVFTPLHSLVELKISNNNLNLVKSGLMYPHIELAALTSLQHLYMDGLQHPRFESGFRNLTSLTVLNLSGYTNGKCNLTGLQQDTFVNLWQVKCLYLEDCSILGELIDRETFKPLTQLVKLDLSYNGHIGLEYLPNVLYGLSNTTTLRYLGLHLIIPRYSLSINLKAESLEFFPSSVEYLDFQENSLEFVHHTVFERLPRCLRKLDLSGNLFAFGSYLKYFHKMENLECLILNGRDFVYRLPDRYPPPPKGNSTVEQFWNDDVESYSQLVFKLPPKLKTIKMKKAGLIYHLTAFHFDANNSLTKLVLRDNRFPSLEGPIKGLPALKVLDLSSCIIGDVKQDFFSSLTSLQELNLAKNNLGGFFNGNASNGIFSKLHELMHLDLSSNEIQHLHKHVFAGLVKMSLLHLGDNLITQFDCDISFMPNLCYLTLSGTHIAGLSKDTRESITNLIKTGVKFHINMSFTPISCDCSNQDFIEWMVKSKAFDKTFPNYKCDYRDLELVMITDSYAEALSILTRKCSPAAYLFVIVISSVVFILLVLGISIGYRFRWNLRYLYHVAYLHYKQDNRLKSRDFEFDAFICYANEDQNFVLDVLEPEMSARGLRLYVHARDFVAGEHITSNVVSAVCRSRKTLVVVTPNMLSSPWCNYEVQMANMEAVHSGRKVLVFLLKGNIGLHRGENLNIFYNIQINTYLEFPSSGDVSHEQMSAMWDKLSRDVMN